jgi:hypothetical protein
LGDCFWGLIAGVRLSGTAAWNGGNDLSSSAGAVALAKQVSHGKKHAADNRQSKKDAKQLARAQCDFSVAHLIGIFCRHLCPSCHSSPGFMLKLASY